MLPIRVAVAVILAIAATQSASAATLSPGLGRFEATHAGRSIPVWYFVPDDAGADTPVLIVMHGVNRDADRYRDEWVPHARRYGFIVLAPEFSKEAWPGEDRYNSGNTLDDQSRPLPREQWSFSYIEPVFDAAKKSLGNRTKQYYLYGHSAGAQFVHRFLYHVPEARVAKAVAANAGWWTLPDPAVDFPYGLRGSAVDVADLKTMLGRPLVVLLGTADTDPNHKNLRRTPEANAQGPHRFARGHTFYEAGQKRAAALGVPLHWQLATAPGVGHSDSGMSVYAVRHLFGQPKIISRSPDRVRILFGGDTSGGESYQDQYAQQGQTNVLIEKGYEHGTVQLDRLLAAADYRVINLETPLTARRDSPLKGKDYLHYSDPVKVPALFSKFGRTAFSLANNHTLDFGPEGLDDTRAALAAAEADWFGGGENLREAAKPLVQEFQLGKQSLTLAIFGTFEYRQDYDRDFHFYASADRPGTAPIDLAAVRQAIAELRKTSPQAFVVYFVHWGGNYAWKTDEQTALARDLRNADVDLIVGHGAHMLQEVEHDGRSWTFYSIGNFLFNARGRYAAHNAPPYSLPLLVDLSLVDGRVQPMVRAYPIVSDNQATGYQPRFVTDEELTQIETLLAEKSAWSPQTRAAIKRGADDCGRYLQCDM
ncbi:MAG TPA: CapA family protein [Pirellulales bacterium]|jgi:poly(3-hydroxybutyrate) depolymerase|nr:CapA family protein [Pirellulales bacterium]